MRLVHYAFSAAFALFLAVASHAQGLGDSCTGANDCDSSCCGEQLDAPVCTEMETIADGLPCFAMDNCECAAGAACNGGACLRVCTTNEECDSQCCSSRGFVPSCFPAMIIANGDDCATSDGCDCISGNCVSGICAACPDGSDVCDDPHMQGLRGQSIDWSGVDGGWYCLVTDDNANIHVNVRLTAPLPETFPNRQLITGVSILSEGHSVAIEVTNPYDVHTDGCPEGTSPCLADGGLRATVDGNDVVGGFLRSFRNENVADGIAVSASNLPVECWQFGGDKIWARMHDEMLQGTRQLTTDESFEYWVLRFDHMAAPEWCAQYIAQHDLAEVQSNHAIFKIDTSAVTVRLNVGTNFQGDGELDWDGRALPDLEFWQMDVGILGLSVESDSLSGILGETSRPVLDKDGQAIMNGNEALRGTADDYRVSGPLGTKFALLNKE